MVNIIYSVEKQTSTIKLYSIIILAITHLDMIVTYLIKPHHVSIREIIVNFSCQLTGHSARLSSGGEIDGGRV